MFNEFIVKNRASIWLCMAVLIVSAAMMAPSFTTFVVALPVEALLLAALRWCAHVEGSRQ